MPNPEESPADLHGLDPGELIARGLNTVHPSGPIHHWTPPTPEELARLLPQFHIESLLGRGGMGAVYKGIQEKLGRPVAIKVLPAELTADAQFVSRFEREARTLARLHHPGIVSIHDFGQTTDGHLYFVMEYVDGTDLQRILQGPGLAPGQALEIITQVCEALHAAHCQGVIHRDIKPANVLITKDGKVKLADFGLARPDREEQGNITLSHVVLGTPDYMAPEQRDGRTDLRADIYALGVMLYEMLTGQLPQGAWAPPSRKVTVDVRIDEVVLKALQYEPDLRYQQASEMKSDVDTIRSGSSSPRPARSFNAGMWSAVLAGVTLFAAGLFWLVSSRSPAPAAPPPPGNESLADGGEHPSPENPALLPARPEAAATRPVPSPASLEEALIPYRWDYVTEKPSHAFSHSLFFQSDGSAYSIGRSRQWRFSWKKTGSHSLRLERERDTLDLIFNETFTRFTGESSNEWSAEGRRSRLRTAGDLEMLENIIRQFPGGPPPPPNGNQTPPP